MKAPLPFGVYVHYPWCLRRCPYCDFNTYAAAGGAAPEARQDSAYADAIIGELRARAPREASGRTLRTLYFGGGTPGLWEPRSLSRVIQEVTSLFQEIGLAALEEVTVEVNPSSSQRDRFGAFVAGGVDRFSIGCQSFQDGTLAALGRLHDGATARAAAGAARAAGAGRISLDLMFGCPGQSLSGFAADVETVLTLRPEHVSIYGLTLEPGTPFAERHAAGALILPDEDEVVEMWMLAEERFAVAGYEHYEISNWALPGERARHNTGYWLGGEYLGLGAGAHSLRRVGTSAYRRVNALQPEAYLAAPDALVDDDAPEPEAVPLGPRGRRTEEGRSAPLTHPVGYRVQAETLRTEDLMCRLRLVEGVQLATFTSRHGWNLERERGDALARAESRGLAERVDGALRLTPLGRRFADDVIASLL